MFKYSYQGALIPIDDLRDRSPNAAVSFTKLPYEGTVIKCWQDGGTKKHFVS